MDEEKSFEMVKERLKKLIFINGLKWGEGLNPDGNIPKWIFDLREVILTPEGAKLASILFYDKIKDIDFNMVGGPSLAAEPLVTSLIMHLYKKGKNVSGFVVRKQPNNFGLRKKVEGPIKNGKKIVIIDDAINAGNSMFDAIESLKKEGCDIIKIVTLIDFCKSGHHKLIEEGYNVDYVFNLEDFELEENKLYRYKNKILLTEVDISKNEEEILQKIDKSIRGEIIDFKVFNNLILVALKEGLLYCLNNDNYSIKWKLELGDSISAPIFIDNKIAIVPAYSGLNRSLLFFVSIDNGTILDYIRIKGNINLTPLLYNDSYLLCSSNYLYKVNKENHYINLIFEASGTITTIPIVENAKEIIYISSSDGNLYALDYNGKEIWKKHYDKIKTTPLIKDEKIIFITQTNIVFCIDKYDGNLIWFSELKNNAFDIKLMSNYLVIGCFRGYIILLDISNGRVLDSFKISNHSIKEIKNYNNKLLVKLEDGNHYFAEIR